MLNERCTLVILALVALVASGLACGLPTPTAVTRPTVTPYVPATARPQDAPTSEPPTDVPEATEALSPTAEEAPPPPATDAPPTATDTLLPTDTSVPPPPPPPTVPPTPTATPTQPATVETLTFVDKGYEIVDWTPLPAKEWEGHLKLIFRGGQPPYTSSIGHRDPQEENYHYFRYAACKNAAVRADVWSADGQHVDRNIWVEAPWCPTPEP
jgi:hypothetical protein